MKVRIKVEGDHAGIKVTGCPHNNFELNIEVPKSSDLYARMFAGQLDVNNISGNKDVELHFGQLTMELGKAEDYRHVDASVMSGDLEASAFNISKGGLFRSFDQDGPGKYRVHAHVGAGKSIFVRDFAKTPGRNWLGRLKRISITSSDAPTTIALSARLKTGH